MVFTAFERGELRLSNPGNSLFLKPRAAGTVGKDLFSGHLLDPPPCTLPNIQEASSSPESRPIPRSRPPRPLPLPEPPGADEGRVQRALGFNAPQGSGSKTVPTAPAPAPGRAPPPPGRVWSGRVSVSTGPQWPFSPHHLCLT